LFQIDPFQSPTLLVHRGREDERGTLGDFGELMGQKNTPYGVSGRSTSVLKTDGVWGGVPGITEARGAEGKETNLLS